MSYTSFGLICVLIWGFIGNKYGRKVALVSCNICYTISAFMLVIVPVNYYFLFFVCFMTLCSHYPAIQYYPLYCAEIGDTDFMNVSTSVVFAGWCFGEFAFIAIGYYVRHWRYLIAIFSFISLLGLLSLLLLFEPPVFLLG